MLARIHWHRRPWRLSVSPVPRTSALDPDHVRELVARHGVSHTAEGFNCSRMTVYRALERAAANAGDTGPIDARLPTAEECDNPPDGAGPHSLRPRLITTTATVQHLDRVIVTARERVIRGDAAGALRALEAARGIVASITGAAHTE